MKDPKPLLVVSVEIRDLFTQFAACFFDGSVSKDGTLMEDYGGCSFVKRFESIGGIASMFKNGFTCMMLPNDDMQGLETWMEDHDDDSFMIELLSNSRVVGTIDGVNVTW